MLVILDAASFFGYLHSPFNMATTLILPSIWRQLGWELCSICLYFFKNLAKKVSNLLLNDIHKSLQATMLPIVPKLFSKTVYLRTTVTCCFFLKTCYNESIDLARSVTLVAVPDVVLNMVSEEDVLVRGGIA